MKKTLLLVAVACAALAANAQALQPLSPMSSISWAKNPTYVTASKKAPAAKAELKDNQVIIGVYDTDAYDEEGGLGFSAATTISVGTIVTDEAYKYYKDLKIDGVRVGIAQDAVVEDVIIYAINSRNEIYETVAEQKYGKKCASGWTTVELDKSVAIPEDAVALLVTYDVVETSAEHYPVGVYSGVENPSLFFFGQFEEGKEAAWYDFSEGGYGTAALQLVVSVATPEGYEFRLDGYHSATVAVGQTFAPTVTVVSTSDKEITSVDYTVTFNGEEKNGTYTFAKPIPAGYFKTGELELELTAPSVAKSYPISVSINGVNGVALDTPVKGTYTQDVVTRIVPRYTIVEEFTGTGCPWCPRGWVGMEKVKEELSDIAGVIAFHWYNTSDPMYVNTYHNPGLQGAPGCKIDRKGEAEPYYGDDNRGIIGSVKRYAAITPEAAVEVAATFTDESMTQVSATASTEFLTDLKGSELVFVLTADGLTSTMSSWRQANNYASYQAAQMGLTKTADPVLYEFCRGGKYGQSYVSLVFNDVMIGSSWPSSTGANKVAKFTTTSAGETATSSYTISLPTKTNLAPFLLKDKMYVTAMVIKADGTIANAARCHVSNPEGINTVLAPVATDEVTYDLSGRVAPVTAKGLLIEGGKKVIR